MPPPSPSSRPTSIDRPPSGHSLPGLNRFDSHQGREGGITWKGKSVGAFLDKALAAWVGDGHIDWDVDLGGAKSGVILISEPGEPNAILNSTLYPSSDILKSYSRTHLKLCPTNKNRVALIIGSLGGDEVTEG